MIDIEIRPFKDCDTRQKYAADGPINFATWIELAQHMDTELIKGVMIDRMAAKYPHEWIFAWLFRLLGIYVRNRKIGIVLGSRTPVHIDNHHGRLPDILFVREENRSIIHDDAIYGIPDLVIEIISDNDYPGTLVPLEADYRNLGIPEIVFLDPKKKRLRHLRKNETDYDETLLTTGKWEPDCVPGFVIEVEWLFIDAKPDEFTIARQLIEAAEANEK